MRVSRLAHFVFIAVAAAAPCAGAPVRAPANEDCQTCHGDPDARRADGRSIFVAGKKFAASVHGQAGLACVDCHADLAKVTDFPHHKRLKPVECAGCHDSGAAHLFHPGIARAARGEGEAEAPCAFCHGGHETVPVKSAGFRFAPPRDIPSCGSCHGEVEARFLGSEHGRAAAAPTRRPTCLSCHRTAVTMGSGADLAALKRVQERLCLSCHLHDKAVRENVVSTPGFIASQRQSVHGAALARGNARAPNCVDCHGAHDERYGFDASSFVNKMRVEQVCARCHQAQSREYASSVHGLAIHRGNKDAPACTDCHGEHRILSPKDPRSAVSAANVSTRVCSPCHASVKLTERWNLPRDRAQTFAESYHGLAARGGFVEVANCASCHGTHDILPSSNPASRISRRNLAKTCGASGCHPGANARFALGSVHVTGTEKDSPLVYWIATIYVVVIVGVVGAMSLHNLLDFARKFRRQLRIRRGGIEEKPVGHGLYLRMTLSERLQHAALALSFTLLVITGFMLRYPEAGWVQIIRRFIPEAFVLRSLTHRIAAVVMVAASLYHAGYLLFTARGRRLLRDLWWRPKDFRDAIDTLKFNAGLSSRRPMYDRFTYIEKSEYWALVWGTLVMAATGIVMWFDNTFIRLFTKLGYDVSRTIHFYEAWLATLAILVWHFYFVIFNPDVYPMNMSWWDGRLTEREMEEEHPLELERMRKSAAESPGKV